MATTARDICKAIMRKLHVLGQGQSVTDGELNDVLENVNDMLASWSVEGSLVYTESSDTFNLVSGQASYTVGTSQDFNTDRILNITSAYVTQGNTDYSLTDYDQAQYARISVKTTQGIPEVYYYNADYPIADLTLYPIPTGATTITLNSEKELTGFSDLDTVYALPPEYKAAIIYNGAVHVSSEYEKEPTPSVYRLASRSKKAIETQNQKNNRYISCLGVPEAENQKNDYDILRGF